MSAEYVQFFQDLMNETLAHIRSDFLSSVTAVSNKMTKDYKKQEAPLNQQHERIVLLDQRILNNESQNKKIQHHTDAQLKTMTKQFQKLKLMFQSSAGAASSSGGEQPPAGPSSSPPSTSTPGFSSNSSAPRTTHQTNKNFGQTRAGPSNNQNDVEDPLVLLKFATLITDDSAEIALKETKVRLDTSTPGPTETIILLVHDYITCRFHMQSDAVAAARALKKLNLTFVDHKGKTEPIGIILSKTHYQRRKGRLLHTIYTAIAENIENTNIKQKVRQVPNRPNHYFAAPSLGPRPSTTTTHTTFIPNSFLPKDSIN